MGNPPIKESSIPIEFDDYVVCSECGTNQLSYSQFNGKIVIWCDNCTPRVRTPLKCPECYTLVDHDLDIDCHCQSCDYDFRDRGQYIV